ncbi:hypothetical protein [Moorena producens]|uniref:hypothetical protein n=1 Tax=Moorena producens TaxID=1155739 RepID=UPI003C742F44
MFNTAIYNSFTNLFQPFTISIPTLFLEDTILLPGDSLDFYEHIFFSSPWLNLVTNLASSLRTNGSLLPSFFAVGPDSSCGVLLTQTNSNNTLHSVFEGFDQPDIAQSYLSLYNLASQFGLNSASSTIYYEKVISTEPQRESYFSPLGAYQYLSFNPLSEIPIDLTGIPFVVHKLTLLPHTRQTPHLHMGMDEFAFCESLDKGGGEGYLQAWLPRTR